MICIEVECGCKMVAKSLGTIKNAQNIKNNYTKYSNTKLDQTQYIVAEIENNCYHVCMESTGKYWIPIFNYLENDIDVCLTHLKYVKAIKGKKTDKKILNGQQIFTSLILSDALLSLQKISDSSVRLPDTASNLSV